jgi:hypothetical protein
MTKTFVCDFSHLILHILIMLVVVTAHSSQEWAMAAEPSTTARTDLGTLTPKTEPTPVQAAEKTAGPTAKAQSQQTAKPTAKAQSQQTATAKPVDMQVAPTKREEKKKRRFSLRVRISKTSFSALKKALTRKIAAMLNVSVDRVSILLKEAQKDPAIRRPKRHLLLLPMPDSEVDSQATSTPSSSASPMDIEVTVEDPIGTLESREPSADSTIKTIQSKSASDLQQILGIEVERPATVLISAMECTGTACATTKVQIRAEEGVGTATTVGVLGAFGAVGALVIVIAHHFGRVE